MSRNLLFDIVVAIAYLVAANPLATGIEIHEWISTGLVVVIVAHTVGHWDWCVETLRALLSKAKSRGAWFIALDVALLVVFSIVTASGIMLSRYVLYAFGLVAQGYFVFVGVHAVSAKVLLLLVLIHVSLHARQVATAVRLRKSAKKDAAANLR